MHKCPCCEKRFKNGDFLKRHVNRVHNWGRRAVFKCELCDRSFCTFKTLELHVVDVHVVDKEFKCSACVKAFITEEDLQAHEVIHEKKYKCDICDSSFGWKCAWKSHIKELHSMAEGCRLCLRSFFTVEAYNLHLENWAEPIFCWENGCTSEFFTQCLLNQHWNESHSVPRPAQAPAPSEDKTSCYSCKVCQQSFPKFFHLMEHKKSAHPREFLCGGCNKRFKLLPFFRLHVKEKHSSEPIFECEACPRKFLTNRQLLAHQWSHDERKHHCCPHCPKYYHIENDLQRHLFTAHGVGEKPFKCPICSAAFFRERDLEKVHMLVHTGNAGFQCPKCPAKFNTERKLTHHVLRVCPKRSDS